MVIPLAVYVAEDSFRVIADRVMAYHFDVDGALKEGFMWVSPLYCLHVMYCCTACAYCFVVLLFHGPQVAPALPHIPPLLVPPFLPTLNPQPSQPML